MSSAVKAQVKASPAIKPVSLPTQSGLLQRKCACGGTPGVDGECEECRSKRLSRRRGVMGHNQPVEVSGTIQTKLTVNKPGDTYEQEADRVAEQVMRIPEPKSSRSKMLSRQAEEEENEPHINNHRLSVPGIQRKPTIDQNCKDKEGNILSGIEEAKELVSPALKALNREIPLSNERKAIELNFGSSISEEQKKVIISRYENIRATLDNKEIKCRSKCKKDKGSDFCAHGDIGSNKIFICPQFGKKGCAPGVTMLHEAAHNAGAAGDVEQGDKNYPPKNAESNAYSYEQFPLDVRKGPPQLNLPAKPEPKIEILRYCCTNRSESSMRSDIVDDVILSPGQPLSSAARSFMEPRFGHDFSNVRIHSDTKAAESARALNALAYTLGRDIVFGAGQYTPETNEGKKLLAHELTHVVQQTGKDHLAESQQIQRFSTKEHLNIGNEAYKEVTASFSKSLTPATIKKSPLFNLLRNGSSFQIGKGKRTYGDIVADPDFFQHFEDLIEKEGHRPDRLGKAVLDARNITHFTPHNIKLWEELHDTAVEQMLLAHHQLEFVAEVLRNLDPLLEQARAAILKEDYDRASKLLTDYQRRFEPERKRLETIIQKAHDLAKQALMRNAFADHFLSDAFSAGHIVTPRNEILKEAGVRLDKPETTGHIVRAAFLGATWEELGQLRAQARSLAWHDLDNFYGVKVENAINETWTACGDQCSERTADKNWIETFKHVKTGVSESIKHLWIAGLNGERPKDYRSVLNLVPRPTWENYPAWGEAEWENQLRYIRGEGVKHVTGERLEPFAVDLFPIEYCGSPELNCWRPFIGTPKDWIKRYSFNSWVQPWITKIQAEGKSRYNF